MKIACLFAGQGAQYPGMGKDLYEKYEESRRVFDAAGEKIRSLCFEGTAEELRMTENTQPCVYTVTMAAYEAFLARFEKEKGGRKDHGDGGIQPRRIRGADGSRRHR